MQGDIRQFATEAVREHHRRGRLLAKNPFLVDNIIERLVDGAYGMFLWVVLQISHILGQRTEHNVKKAINDLPRGLFATYIRFLTRLSAQATERQTEASSSLGCLFYNWM